jgi:thiamine-phosphate pyrophosphorylase
LAGARCRLYLITPPAIEIEDFAGKLEAALSAGDAACLQLRLKPADDAAIRAATQRLMPIAHAHNVAFLINDRPDLAAELGADGVHIGQEDGDYASARKIMGTERIVGVTCHDSQHLGLEAAEAGADYVAFGAFFPTATKAAKTKAELEVLTWWRDVMLTPCVAIGGVTVANCAALAEAGADFIAVSSGVWDYPDGPAEAVRAFNRALPK